MTSKSSFLPRLAFSRGDGPILPLHNYSSPPIRKKASEYALSDLSPRPDDRLLDSDPQKHLPYDYDSRSQSPTVPFADDGVKQRPLFTGPPPPIATSRLLYRDEEDTDSFRPPRALEGSSLVRNINSVLFDRSSQVRPRDQKKDYEPDAIWRNLQHRERALQKELQLLLDAQSAGLAAHLDPNAPPSSSARSDASDAGSSTPTDSSMSHRRRPHASFEQPIRATPTGEIIPVRQPRKKPLGLRATRAGLARNITLLADLKAEEDANLASALSVRKKALSQLRKLAVRKDGIAEELRTLEASEEAPLSQDIRELEEEHQGVTTEISELEERLVGLRNRRRWLEGRMEDTKNLREASLSGYKGALKEVDSKVLTILRKPPVKPLDIEAIAGPPMSNSHELVDQSPGGTEFLRMRPERRTIEMAREWWEGEVRILERRKQEVDKERTALEEGVEVWKTAVELITNFETGLRQELRGGQAENAGKGKSVALTPEQAMHGQLEKMATVMAGLGECLQIAEERGWNLLICAIGAELEAFREAEGLLRQALRATGSGLEKTDSNSSSRNNSIHKSNNLVDLQEEKEGSPDDVAEKKDRSILDESDNEVPPDLLASSVSTLPQHGQERDQRQVEVQSPALSRDDSLMSENEVPPEFLAEHDDHEVE
ncbi:hypothetical protein QBC37DRAFT_276972 [Rhypophila decipiens]|uniref:Atg28p n=1 Tax=Rhypophila decipiens TaxID=261697 RepID=A0AAN6YIS3_9PEZI|nr:hypothetical protein QBC37DRAFT_276972 [Rhypophila decipiens]